MNYHKNAHNNLFSVVDFSHFYYLKFILLLHLTYYNNLGPTRQQKDDKNIKLYYYRSTMATPLVLPTYILQQLWPQNKSHKQVY